MQKRSVIVSTLPWDCEGSREEVPTGEYEPDGTPVTKVVITPDMLKLEADGTVWRARLGTPTPIPEEIIPALEASGAAWKFDPPATAA